MSLVVIVILGIPIPIINPNLTVLYYSGGIGPLFCSLNKVIPLTFIDELIGFLSGFFIFFLLSSQTNYNSFICSVKKLIWNYNETCNL